jgi:uncharacterized membrane protein YbhN (UPF0104 family)
MAWSLSREAFKKLRRVAGIVVVAAVFIAAMWLLFNQLKDYKLSEIRDSLRSISSGRIWGAMALVVLNYAILAGYDLLAIRSIRHPLPLPKVAMASFVGYASSFNFGVLLGGLSVRYRLYSAWGLSPIEIGKLLVVLTVTFWIGLFALSGVVFVAQPIAIPKDFPLPFSTVRPLGYLLLAATIAYLLLCALGARQIRIRGRVIPLPKLHFAASQLSVASADLLVAAGILYVLLPPSLDVSYVSFLGVYLLVIVAVLFTNVPGGLGVMEVMVLALLSPSQPPAVIASLLAFRILYYLGPLAIAATLFVLHEAWLIGSRLRRRRRLQSAPPAPP